MGVASLVLGIISVVTGWIPFMCFIAFALAIVGLILGIVDTVKKTKEDKKRGISIAGLIVSAIAIPIVIYTSLFSLIIFGIVMEEQFYDSYDYEEDYRWEENYNYDYWNSEYDESLRNYNILDYYDSI